MLEELIVGNNTLQALSQPGLWTMTKPTAFDRLVWFVSGWEFWAILGVGLIVAWVYFRWIARNT